MHKAFGKEIEIPAELYLHNSIGYKDNIILRKLYFEFSYNFILALVVEYYSLDKEIGKSGEMRSSSGGRIIVTPNEFSKIKIKGRKKKEGTSMSPDARSGSSRKRELISGSFQTSIRHHRQAARHVNNFTPASGIGAASHCAMSPTRSST